MSTELRIYFKYKSVIHVMKRFFFLLQALKKMMLWNDILRYTYSMTYEVPMETEIQIIRVVSVETSAAQKGFIPSQVKHFL